MDEIRELFEMIGKTGLDENESDLLGSGAINSLDIIALVNVIEAKYGKTLNGKYIEAENFESFSAIKAMLEKAFA